MPTPLIARAQSAPNRSPRRRRHGPVVGAALVGALLLAACGGGASSAAPEATDPPATSSTVEPSTTTTISTQLVTRGEVEAAYSKYWQAWLALNDPPQPTHPDLERWATGAQLARTVDAIRDRLEQGLVMRRSPAGKYRHEVREVRVDGDTATVIDCAVDDAVIAARSDGRILNDAVSTRLLQSSMVRTVEGWKLADVATVNTWEGEQSCVP